MEIGLVIDLVAFENYVSLVPHLFRTMPSQISAVPKDA